MKFLERLKPAAKEAKLWILFTALGIGAYISIEAWRASIWLLVCLTWGIVLIRDPLNFRGFTEMLNGTAWP